MLSVAPQITHQVNDRVALDLLLERGQMTRSDMRAVTGMSQPSTLELFDRLLADDLIETAGSVSGRRGPQALTYRINPRRALVAVAESTPARPWRRPPTSAGGSSAPAWPNLRVRSCLRPSASTR